MAHWLDKIIAEQAAIMGMSEEDHALLMDAAAVVQERIERYGVDKPEQLPDLPTEGWGSW